VEELLRQFANAADPGPFDATHCHHFAGVGTDQRHLVFGFLVHGNEHGTLPSALRLVQELNAGILKPKSAVTLFLGNPCAARKNVRFVDEDLNRVFTFDREADNLERRRASELRPILDAADVFVDFHQTQTPTASAFWTFPWSAEMAQWAAISGAAPLGLTRAPGRAFSMGKCCLDEYVRGRGRVGITAEMGSKGQDPLQAEETYQAIRRLLTASDRQQQKDATLAELAAASPVISWYETAEVVPAESREHRLRPGLENWIRVSEGELLSPEGAPELRAGFGGCLLFPKYPRDDEPPPPELFRIGRRISDPAAHYSSAG
jgi:succinylglutamate desuccinylase